MLSARIGIHTGNVVIGQMGGTGRTETLAMGDTTNIAARVQGLADPDTVVMSQATLKLVPGLFITRDLDEQALKGVDKPLCLYQVIQPSGVRSRLEAAEKLTPFVGREAELALLNDRWQQAQECLGQAVLITGEPGVGKSRLLLNLNAQLTDTAHTWLECRAFALTRNSAYHPVTELLNRGLSINEGDTQQTKLLRLEEALDRVGQDRAEAVPLLAPLLNLALPAKFAPSPYSPELKRKKTINLLNGWLLALAGQQPLILAVEDLHWADPSTIELLGNLIQRMPAHPILAVFTARPEFQPNWPLSPHLATLALPPLRSAESGALLDHLLEQRPLPNPVKDRIVKQANGVPLFLEEVTRALIESGQLIERDGRLELAGSLESPSIPATLQDALMARLDRLDEAKSIAQVCGVIGREIPYRLLHAVVDTDEAELQWHLKMLTDVQLLYQRGSPPDATYVFKHALIQDTAYHSLLKSTRQKLHGKIAHTLETGFNERAKSEPALLAEHFEKAGLIEPAVKYYKAAAKLSAARSALEDAIHFQEKALKLIALLPEASTRDRLEVGLVAALVPWLSLSRGYTHPSVRSALEHARALPALAADPIAQANVLGFSFATHHFAGEYAAAARYGEELVELGRSMNMPAIEAQGHANAASAYLVMAPLNK
ncbi:MAG: AAA family ATPase, partial [Nevskiales bacterium]